MSQPSKSGLSYGLNVPGNSLLLKILLVSLPLISACQSINSPVSILSDITQTKESSSGSIKSLNQGNTVSSDPETEGDAKPQSDSDAQPTLSADLINDLLIANIASRRGLYEPAAQALVNAAKASRNSRVVAEAIRLSSASGNFEQVIELTYLLEEITPSYAGILITRASAQFKQNDTEAGLETLTTLISNHGSDSADNQDIFVNIANLLYQQTSKAQSSTAEQSTTGQSTTEQSKSVSDAFFSIADEAPNDAALNFVASVLASRQDDIEKVVHYVDRALQNRPGWEAAAILKLDKLQPTDEQVRKDQAIKDQDNKGPRHKNVIDFAEAFLKDHPESNDFRLFYARILLQNRETEMAYDELKTILSYDPDSGEALFTIGLVYLDTQRLDEAEASFTRLLKGFPEHNQSKIYLAEIASQKEQYDRAIVYLQQVDGQQYIDAQISLARVLVKQKGAIAGFDYLRKIGARSDEDKLRLLLEQDSILREAKEFDRLKEHLDDSLKQFPDQPDLLYNRGLIAAQMGLLDIHEKDLRKLISLQPENAHALNALGYTLADKTDRLEEALELIEKANALLPDNPFILDSLGWVHYRLGDNDKAIKFLRLAFELSPDAEIAAHLGEVLWLIGDKKEARDIWEQGQKLADDNEVLIETMERLANDQQSFRHFELPLSIAVVHLRPSVSTYDHLWGQHHLSAT